MASLAKGPNGRHRILVTVRDRRETVSLNSKIRRSEAVKILHHVEELATAANYGTQRDAKTSRWLAELSPTFRARLAAKGLCEPVESAGTVTPKSLGAMITTIKANEWGTLAASTVAIYERVQANLRDYFGAERKPDTITPGDAEAFATWLRSHVKLAHATANKRTAIASKFFRSAIKYKWLDENPFDGVKKTNIATTRFRFIETAEAEAVLKQLPTREWRLLFALSRWGGLRVASEPRQLKWGHVDWQNNRLLVPCPKTANSGRAIRVVPIFPELYPILRGHFESPQDGQEWLLPMLRGISDAALRRPLQQAIKAAGVEAWPRLWHTMRASRQIELTDDFPAHVVSRWVGNSVSTAQRHYLRTTDDHFDRAVGRASDSQGESNNREDRSVSIGRPKKSASTVATD